jgi:outer membrane protein assembly factor BamB
MTPQGVYLADGLQFETVHAWSLADGQPRWTWQATARLEGVVADASGVYLASAIYLLALQAESGQVRWRAANPDSLTTLHEEAGILLGVNPLTSTLAGYDLASGQRLFRLQPLALTQYLIVDPQAQPPLTGERQADPIDIQTEHP